MSTELTLSDQMSYAQAIVAQPERGSTSLLPKAYQGNPANVLIAMGLGQALDLTPAQALYEIYVVNGRPSPSANLMAGLVRRAGHKLRIDGDATQCTATLIRKDDPEAPFTATWTIEQARAAGLTGKDTWKAYPAAMLRARAISEVVRMGSSESVLGMDYSAEEMRDVEPRDEPTPAKPRGMDAVRQAVLHPPADAPPATNPAPAEDVQDAEVVGDVTDAVELISDSQRRAMFAAFTKAGFTTDARSEEGRATRLAYIGRIVGHDIETSSDLTSAEASKVIDALNQDAAEQEPAGGGA